jgi:(1->4)-alpha-D-glucan 1-alpha-D-glucosylmutase
VPLRPSGTRDDHLVAYVRGHDVLVAVTRLPLGVADGWHGTTLDLPEGRWRSALHPDHDLVAGTVEVADLLAAAPVAVLERVADPVA